MTNQKNNNTVSLPRVPRVLVSGGGTGGHIFPAIAIANAVRRRHPQADILFAGAEGRMEMTRVPAAGYPVVGLPVAGFDRRRPWRNIAVIAKLIKSMRRAKKLLAQFEPDICIGVGGYASGPVLKAAQRRGIPTLIQEQNSYAGVTNRLLAKKAHAICTAYDRMDRFFDNPAIIKTGNPLRADVLACTLSRADAKKNLGFDPAKPLVLSLGGSLGARTVNTAMSAALPAFDRQGLQLLWQTGKTGFENAAAAATPYKNVQTTAFINDMGTAFAAADIVVSRAGAGTISELQCLGKAAVLVPSPNVAEDHQRKNALALVARGAAVMVGDHDAPATLARTVCDLAADPARLQQMQANINAMAMPGADRKIAAVIDGILARTMK